MSVKETLIRDVNGGMSVSDAAERQGIDRSCAYKWVARYRSEGRDGLEERSRAPELSPNRTPQKYVDELLALKKKYPDFGPAKLAPMLASKHGKRIMAVSTAGELLARHALVRKRPMRHPRAGKIEHPPFKVGGAGDSMTADFKGQFLMKNGALCYPLTIADPFSRYVFAIDALPSTHTQGARAGFERVFREYGIPRQIITDNGGPFCCSKALGGLTRLSRWWIELGILPTRIQPGRPQQNGVHERMHRTLKDWLGRNVQSSLRKQQRSFDAFQKEFNEVRPHQSLGQKTPASVVQSYRPYASRPRKMDYDSNMTVRSVRSNGHIKWSGGQLFLSDVLIGARVGLLEVDEALWAIFFGPVRIGYLDTQTGRVQNRVPERLAPKPSEPSVS